MSKTMTLIGLTAVVGISVGIAALADMRDNSRYEQRVDIIKNHYSENVGHLNGSQGKRMLADLAERRGTVMKYPVGDYDATLFYVGSSWNGRDNPSSIIQHGEEVIIKLGKSDIMALLYRKRDH